ncbi:MAG: hypothetical protein AAFV95_15415 [Bacteroidota bacterium]
MKNTLLLLLCCCCGLAKLSGQALTDSTITMIAFWSNQVYVEYDFVYTEEELEEGDTIRKRTEFEVIMSILDSTENSYMLQWEYGNYEMNYEMTPLEKNILELCAEFPVVYETDELGTFQGLTNWKEMKQVAKGIVGKYLESKRDSLPDSLAVKVERMVLGLFESENQMSYWAKDLHFFHYLYGATLSRTVPFEGVKYYTNPFIQQQMPGIQRIEVLDIDEETWTARIKVTSGIGGDQAKALMYDYLINNLEKLGLEAEEVTKEKLPGLSVQEELYCTYDILSGYILEGSYSKRVKSEEDFKNVKYTYKLRN